MEQERWSRVEELYHSALERPPEHRAAFLAEVCADLELRCEVEALLAQPGDGILDHPVAQAVAGGRLGPYEIRRAIGAGGMGQVFEARDSRLGRSVAIKICSAEFASRFAREAQAISALNHANICTLYDVGPNYLVMELVEGPTLAERIKQGPVPLEEALAIAKQIAEAVEAAHERGIVHRDLKPGNIKLRPDGAVKVLDFGLAKVIESSDAGPLREDSPTVTLEAATRAGTILGTAAYMSPEQALGKAADKRADIWSFGAVLYELLSCRRAFGGESASDILAAVLKVEPDWSALPQETPAAIRTLIRRCLTKDRRQRLQAIGDARIVIEECLSGAPPEIVEPAPVRRSIVPWAVAGVLAIVAIASIAVAWRAARPLDHPLTRLSVDLGPNALTGLNLTIAISPDGRRLVFPARGSDGKQQLATRPLDQAEPTLLPGTEGGRDPFFSPDGRWIGFYAAGQLKKISAQGGAPVVLGHTLTAFGYGASRRDDGNIAAAMGPVDPLSLIPASGSALNPLTRLGSGENTHRWPQFLPGGNAVLFTASSSPSSWDNASIEAISLKTGQVKTLQRGGYYGRYLPAGYLVYVHQGVLFGVRFDPDKLEVRGAPTPVLEDVAANPTTGGGQFDFSNTGTFVYAAGKSAAQAWEVDWLDSSGKMQPLLASPGAYGVPRLSPDGRKLAFMNGGDIYIYDTDRDTSSRLTFTGYNSVPVWAPDGRHIIQQTTGGFSWARSDGAVAPQLVVEGPNPVIPWSISPDGRRLAYFENSPETGFDIWTLPLDVTDPDHPKPGAPAPSLRTPADETVPRFSPDGRWIAYRSNESGSNEIYVRPFPADSGGKWQISSGGGLFAFWSSNGRELFYETADNRIMVVDYAVDGGSFVPGKPRVWSDKQLFYTGTSNLDLAPDGKRFAVFALPETAPEANGSVRVTMLFNFFDELKRRIP